MAKLLSGNREWWAPYADREEINSAEIAAADLPDVGLDNAPLGPVEPERIAGMRINFHCRRALKARSLKPKCLSAAARAQFQHRQSHLCASDVRLRSRQVKLTCLSRAAF